MTTSYYSQDNHGPFETHSLGDFVLERGGTLRNLELAFATFGTLSHKRDNAILFPTWYSGSSKALELGYVGKGCALDPDKYFIILVNQIGNGLSSAPHDAPPPFNAARFPFVTIGDDVRAQHRLVTEKFGIERLELVLGGSMGAQQAYEWAIRYPGAVKRVAPIAGSAGGTAHNRLLVETFIEAIASDPAFAQGWYGSAHEVQRGLRRHARLFAASGFTPRLFNDAVWKTLGFSSTDDFITGFVEGHFVGQDPNNLLLLLEKWRAYDAATLSGGDLAAALARITARVFVIAIEEDAFFPLEDIAREQSLVPNSELRVVSSPWGHLALFGIDAAYNESVDRHLKELLGAATPHAKWTTAPSPLAELTH